MDYIERTENETREDLEERLLDLLLAEEGFSGRAKTSSFQESSTGNQRPDTALFSQQVDSPLSFDKDYMRTQERPDKLPLSFAQERLWFLDQLNPFSSTYNMSGALRLTGPISLRALEQSLRTIIQRHETLRTTIVLDQGQPLQKLARAISLPTPLIDLQNFPESTRLVTLLFREEVQRPFNLSEGSLLRISLVRLAEQEHILLLTIHHIICDSWSISVLIHELSLLYQAEIENKPLSLPKLSVQYADYALWQRKYLQSEVLQEQMNYWRHQLAGAPVVLNLPFDRPRPPVQTFTGAVETVFVPAQLFHELKVLSQREGVTLFMTLLAAFQVLLMRYSGQEDIVVGTPVANRTRPELERLIGFFVNTLVLRTDLSGNPGFSQLLARVREVTLGAYMHQDLPFEQLVEAMQVERSLSSSPLFQVLFMFQNFPLAPLKLADASWSQMKVEQQTSKFDLSLILSEEPFGLLVEAEYAADLFEATTIQRLLTHWQILLQSIVANPHCPISELCLLDEVERTTVLSTWNQTQQILNTQAQGIHQLFEAQVDRTPEAIALVYAEQQLTYHELNQRANQSAHLLRASGVGPDVRVGFYLDRSVNVFIGLLAILKAGGAYVPLDLSYPSDRLAYVIQDAQLALVLTERRFRMQVDAVNARISPPVLCLDQPSKELAAQGMTNPVSWSQNAHLAYVMYTSGSTGQPKGVAFPHGALVNLLAWQAQDCPLTVGTPVLQFSALTFDASCQELFSTWQQGGKIVVPEHDAIRQDPEALATLMTREQVERWFVPYVGLQHVAQWVGKHSMKLQAIFTAGEQLQITPAIARWLYEMKECQLFNYYGPTESHVVTSCHLLGDPAQWETLPPIGRPIANTQIYLLDTYLQVVPIGIPGELYIGGVSLARGYLNRPELTAERFVPDHLSGQIGARLYKTGDQARYREDSSIEFLGRLDQQVKLRGFRIELGEIEATLLAHPAVQGAAAVLRGEELSEKYLVAYVVPQTSGEVTVQQLQSYLREHLPDYMVPVSFLFLEALPLTPTGKVLRSALPESEQAQRSRAGVYVAPSTPVQETLALIWMELLHVPDISVRENFFELGGHSLLATRAIARINEIFQLKLPLRSIFENVCIVDMASVIEAKQREKLTKADNKDLRRMLIEMGGLSAEDLQSIFSTFIDV